jgi:hypothetical protein
VGKVVLRLVIFPVKKTVSQGNFWLLTSVLFRDKP